MKNLKVSASTLFAKAGETNQEQELVVQRQRELLPKLME